MRREEGRAEEGPRPAKAAPEGLDEPRLDFEFQWADDTGEEDFPEAKTKGWKDDPVV